MNAPFEDTGSVTPVSALTSTIHSAVDEIVDVINEYLDIPSQNDDVTSNDGQNNVNMEKDDGWCASTRES